MECYSSLLKVNQKFLYYSFLYSFYFFIHFIIIIDIQVSPGFYLYGGKTRNDNLAQKSVGHELKVKKCLLFFFFFYIFYFYFYSHLFYFLNFNYLIFYLF